MFMSSNVNFFTGAWEVGDLPWARMGPGCIQLLLAF